MSSDLKDQDTPTRGAPRPGGRSARVQAAVHQAVHDLETTLGREALTVPGIAARAGVTPSTIYRRWGDLGQLLSDVAAARLQGDVTPADTGGLISDLEHWACAYVDEMTSDLGHQMLRDLLAGTSGGNACQCADVTMQQFDLIAERARARGEAVPSSALLLDLVVAPLIYRLLFSHHPPDAAMARRLIARALTTATATGDH